MREGSERANNAAALFLATSQLFVFGLMFVLAWRDGGIFWILLGMLAVAALLAHRLARTHRSKCRNDRRGVPEADSVEWEEPC